MLRSNLSFRLRHLLGVGARAEVVRLLYTMDAFGTTTAKLARSAGYTKRNVHESLSSLEQVGAIAALHGGYELRYWIDRKRWSAFLDVRQPIEDVDWVPLLLSMRRALRWYRSICDAELSDYLVSSSARDLLERIRPDLEEAGVDVPRRGRAITALDDLGAVVNNAFDNPASISRSASDRARRERGRPTQDSVPSGANASTVAARSVFAARCSKSAS